MNTELFTTEITELFPFLKTILQDGGLKKYELQGTISTFRNQFGYSGFNYESENQRGVISFGMILGGTGFILKRLLDNSIEKYDYFNLKGQLTFSADKEALKPLLIDQYEMDLTCPILDHCYNFLSYEYKLAADGKSSTPLVHSVEIFLNTLLKSSSTKLPILNRANDSAVTKIFDKMLQIENDPILTWEERQLIFSKNQETVGHILSTKTRAHKLSRISIKLSLLRLKFDHFISRLVTRPADNLKGILYKYTVGKVLWFFRTVKNNLGYSVALAVYGPFTYYFITMPMNPHAMQAVGKVRSTYLDFKQEIANIIDENPTQTTVYEPTREIKVPLKSDLVTTTNAAPLKNSALANIIFASSVTGKNEPVMLTLGEAKSATVQPSLLNMLLATDNEQINQQSWLERMSSFKQMQIAYEENIEYASRMGRLEQLETQYNFPMQVEQTWEELERYNNLIFKIRSENQNISAKMKQYLFNEVNRTQQLQLYLWDRMGRFILDQIYVMLDQDGEQQRNDYYVGRSFILMQEMTQTLSWRYQNLKKPEGYERIEKLADFYKKSRKELGTISKNLTANSALFKQQNVLDTKEFRAHMKRQWEILFLQNAKAEEAANMGLNMYIWSVRNTVWILQSIFSTKREELALLIKRDTTGSLLTADELLARSKASMAYETLFHNLVLEYVGIREEIMNRLGKDIESVQRKVVIENLKEFISDRDKLDGLGVSKTSEQNQTAKANL
jgi:hypothetical protein